MEGDTPRRLADWLARFGGPGFRDFEDQQQAIAEMRAAGTEELFLLLVPMLADRDPEVRCTGCTAVLLVNADEGLPLVLPLLEDPEDTVRWHTCGCLHEAGDDRAIVPLVRVLQSDKDPQVRGTAAYALGGIGSPAAIPALIAALESDHEYDGLGHSASSCAATALDDILGTNETRTKVSATLCKLSPWPPDLAALKRRAWAVYKSWSLRHFTEPGLLQTDSP
jgi:HEAT repeat protein